MKPGLLKKILIGVVAFVGVFIGGTALTLSLIDWNEYRDTVESAAAAGLGVQVDLSGDIGVTLFPRPTLEAEAVTLYSSESDDGVIAIAKRIDVQLALSALLKGDVSLENLELVGLEIALQESDTGGWSLKGWPVSDGSDEDSADSDNSTLQLDRLSLTGAQVAIHRNSGDVRYIKALDLNLSGTFPMGPIDWEGQFFLDDLQVGLNGRLRPVLADNALSLRAGFAVEGGTVTWSGRFGGDGGDIVGRIVAEGPSVASFTSNMSTAIGLPYQITSSEEAPFLVDLQAEGQGDILTVVSKQLNINETRGRLDLTMASSPNGPNITGALAFSIIDAANWQNMTFATGDISEAGTGEQTAINQLPFSGALDVTVEGVRVAGDMVQNIDFTIEATAGSIGLSKFQALFPGGTAVAARASVVTSGPLDGNGAISLVSGRLPTLLDWAGIDVKDKLPVGRLATAKLASRLRFDVNGWQLTGLSGNVDTANFNGDMSGTYVAPFLGDISLAVDQVNLDAYLPERVDTDESADAEFYFPENAIAFDLKGEKLLFRGRQYSAVAVKGEWTLEGVKVQNGRANIGDGSLSFTGGVSRANDVLSYELNAGVADFPVAVLAKEIPVIEEYTTALTIQKATGSISVLGPMDDLRVSATMDHGLGKTWNLTGSLALNGFTPNKLALQGSIRHPDIAQLIKEYGVDTSSTPIDLTITASKADPAAPIELRSTGEAGDGRIILDLASGDNGFSGDISYDHPSARNFSRQFRLGTPLPNPTEPLHLKAKASYADSEWSVTDIDVSNGQATIKGAVTANENKTVNGDLQFANWTTALPDRGEIETNVSDEVSIKLADFADYVGSIRLNMDRVNIFGQTLTVSAGALQMGDGVAFINLGEGALLNGQPLGGSLNITMDPTPSFALKLDVQNMDIASMLVGAGYSDVVTGVSALTLDISAEGNSLTEILGTLRGTGRFNGQAGVLNFLDVPTLISDIEAATSGRAFLNVIGSRLRGGQTNFGSLQASFTLDSGIALVEDFKAAGTWGVLELGGQLNLLDEFMDLSGALALARPLDAPAVPVNYRGSLSAPSGGWASRALERFVIAGIERRFRSKIFEGLEKVQTESGEERAPSAGSAVFESAISILGQIRKRQQDKKEQDKKADEGTGETGNEF